MSRLLGANRSAAAGENAMIWWILLYSAITVLNRSAALYIMVAGISPYPAGGPSSHGSMA